MIHMDLDVPEICCRILIANYDSQGIILNSSKFLRYWRSKFRLHLKVRALNLIFHNPITDLNPILKQLFFLQGGGGQFLPFKKLE